MSLLTLPPIWEKWTQKDLEGLTPDELDELWRNLHMNEMLILDRFEYETYFKKRGMRTISSLYYNNNKGDLSN